MGKLQDEADGSCNWPPTVMSVEVSGQISTIRLHPGPLYSGPIPPLLPIDKNDAAAADDRRAHNSHGKLLYGHVLCVQSLKGYVSTGREIGRYLEEKCLIISEASF